MRRKGNFYTKVSKLRTLSLQNKNLYDLRVDLYDLRMDFGKKAVLLCDNLRKRNPVIT